MNQIARFFAPVYMMLVIAIFVHLMGCKNDRPSIASDPQTRPLAQTTSHQSKMEVTKPDVSMSDPTPAGGDDAAAVVTFSVVAPDANIDPKKDPKKTVPPDHVYISYGFTHHRDMRPDMMAKWQDGSAWETSRTCQVYAGNKLTCTISKPAGYDIRFQISVQREDVIHYLCSPYDSPDPGGAAFTVSGIATSKIVHTQGPVEASANCNYGS